MSTTSENLKQGECAEIYRNGSGISAHSLPKKKNKERKKDTQEIMKEKK